MTNVELLVLHNNTWNHLNVCKKLSSGLFKSVIDKLSVNKSYIERERERKKENRIWHQKPTRVDMP